MYPGLGRAGPLSGTHAVWIAARFHTREEKPYLGAVEEAVLASSLVLAPEPLATPVDPGSNRAVPD